MGLAPFRFIAPAPRLTTPELWQDELRAIEDGGYYAVAVSEHYALRWAMDAWTAVTYALASTRSLRVFSLVLNNDFHHPAMLAKALATADLLSSGRVGLGIGAGWLPDDYKPLGLTFDSPGQRLDRLDEALTVIDRFFADDSLTFDGEYYKIDGLDCVPKTARPPILVGAGGRKALGVAGRHADIVGLHPRMSPKGFSEQAAADLSRNNVLAKIEVLHTASRAVNRPMPQLQFSCYDINIGGTQVTPFRPGFTEYIDSHPHDFRDTPGTLRGDVDHCVDQLLRWREELGITYWNLGSDRQAVAAIVSRLSAQ